MPTPASARRAANAAAASRCDGGPDCEPVKTAMRTGRSAAVVPVDRLRDADRLVAALALDDAGEGELQSAGDLLDVGQRRLHPHLGAHRNRRGEPHLVQAVVYAHRCVGHDEDLREERDQQGERQVAVRDRTAEGALRLRPLHVDVDPLVVTGGVGEEVDVVLGDLEPVAGTQLGADETGQLGHRGRSGHAEAFLRGTCGRQVFFVERFFVERSFVRTFLRRTSCSAYRGKQSTSFRGPTLHPAPLAAPAGYRVHWGTWLPPPTAGRSARRATGTGAGRVRPVCCCTATASREPRSSFSTAPGGRTTAARGELPAAPSTWGSRLTSGRSGRSARSSGSPPRTSSWAPTPSTTTEGGRTRPSWPARRARSTPRSCGWTARATVRRGCRWSICTRWSCIRGWPPRCPGFSRR